MHHIGAKHIKHILVDSIVIVLVCKNNCTFYFKFMMRFTIVYCKQILILYQMRWNSAVQNFVVIEIVFCIVTLVWCWQVIYLLLTLMLYIGDTLFSTKGCKIAAISALQHCKHSRISTNRKFSRSAIDNIVQNLFLSLTSWCVMLSQPSSKKVPHPILHYLWSGQPRQMSGLSCPLVQFCHQCRLDMQHLLWCGSYIGLKLHPRV